MDLNGSETQEQLSAVEVQQIEAAVNYYLDKRSHVKHFLGPLKDRIEESESLMRHVHSIKARLKDPEHLREKLGRKILAARKIGKAYDVTPENLFTKVTDLAGIRLLHLHSTQIESIDVELQRMLSEFGFDLVERPFARTWDDESKAYFERIGFETQKSPTMYTSVHYVVGSTSKLVIRGEIQVRTLMEEVWGEVDHSINYPVPTDSIACMEQLKALARVSSGSSRLVDAIFASHVDHEKRRIKNFE